MDKYAMSQILLSMWMPNINLPYIQRIGRSTRFEGKQIIILKARGSISNRVEAMLMKQMIEESKNNDVVILAGRNIDGSHVADVLKNIDKDDFENMLTCKPRILEKPPEIPIEPLIIPEDKFSFIPKKFDQSAKPGSKEDRKRQNNYQKNSYCKKRRK
jgi:hypothetical protein